MDYDIGSDESVSMAVLRAVSALNDCELSAMAPLANFVDPEALNALFAARNNEKSRLGGRVSFVYEHCRVTVDNGEYLTVQPLRIRPRPAGHEGLDVTDTH